MEEWIYEKYAHLSGDYGPREHREWLDKQAKIRADKARSKAKAIATFKRDCKRK